MFFEKKDKNAGLPDLPDNNHHASLPSIDEYPRMARNIPNREEINELPSFPDSPSRKGFSQSAIKDAVSTGDIKEESLSELPEFEEEEDHESEANPSNDNFKLTEMEDWSPPTEATPARPSRHISESKPLFIKLDKFREAKSSLEKIKTGLGEIEELLKQVREVKAKEDQELSHWEKEMENVKARISNITADIFERVDN